MAKKNKKTDSNRVSANENAVVVYCAPTIPGVVRQYTVFNNGLPAPVQAAIKNNPILGALVLPLDQMAAAMQQIRDKNGEIYNLYKIAQKKLNGGN